MDKTLVQFSLIACFVCMLTLLITPKGTMAICNTPKFPCNLGTENSLCALDCSKNHYATGGSCSGDVCGCTGTPTGQSENSAQCRFENPPGEDTICLTDCTCNHGTTNGTCDYTWKRCICHNN